MHPCCVPTTLGRHIFQGSESDKKYRGWAQVLASFLICLCTLGLVNSFGVFQSFYQQELLKSYSASSISWIGTTQGFLLSSVGILSGALYDRGYFRVLIYVGAVLSVAGIFITSFVTDFPSVFILFGAVVGLGCGAMYTPSLVVLSAHFTSGLSVASAIATTGSSIGGIMYPILFRDLVDRLSYPWACRIFAFMNGGLLLISCLLIQPPKKLIAAMEETPNTSPVRQGPCQHLKNLRDRHFVILCVSLLLLIAGVDIPFFFLPTIAQEKIHLQARSGDLLLAGLNAATLLGRLVLGSLCSFYTPTRVWLLSIFSCAILLSSWTAINTLASTIIFVAFYGFFVGGLTTLTSPVLRAMSPEDDFGGRLGLTQGFQGVGFLIGAPIAGAILQGPASYLGVSILFGALYSMVFFVLAYLLSRTRSPRGSLNEARNDTELGAIAPSDRTAEC
ncbi:MFS general substrate transporter [Xylariaceae sp. FL1651]|nr:MFS general substrate transporter [Xylariaceae sp. FL1651]